MRDKKNLPCKPSEVIFLVWKDAQGESARCNYDNIAQLTLAVNTNLGWIVHENDERVIFAHGSSTTGELDVFNIPKVNILDRIPVVRQRAKKDKPSSEAPSSTERK